MRQNYIVLKLRAWIVAILLCIVSHTCWAEESGGLNFSLDSENKTATVTGLADESMKEVEIPATVEFDGVVYSVTTIGDDAFRGCSGLTSIDIPEGVTTIGDDAFRDCSGLTSIDIPECVTTIASYAFYGCSGLTSVTCNCSTPPTAKEWTFYGFDCSNATLYVPKGAEEAYKNADYWKYFKTITTSTAINDIEIGDGAHIVSIFDLSGKLISRGNAGQLPKGLYIVVVDGKATKVSVR